MTLIQLKHGVAHFFILAGIGTFVVGACAVLALMFLEAHTLQIMGGPVVFHPRWEPWFSLAERIIYVAIPGAFLLLFLGGLLLRGIPPSVRRGWKFCGRKFTRAIQYIVGTSSASMSQWRLILFEFKVAMVCSIILAGTPLLGFEEETQVLITAATIAIGGIFVKLRVVRVMRQ
ncbi:MAG: hypothetical protein Q7S49_00625 [bacterium]|nr:hypothetical protein [bacterium]